MDNSKYIDNPLVCRSIESKDSPQYNEAVIRNHHEIHPMTRNQRVML